MKEYSQEKNTWNFVREFKILEALDKIEDDAEESSTVEIDGETKESFRKKARELVSPFQWYIQPGEIRLLPQTERLTYGVVLPWSWSHCLLVPLSHCQNPATDEELYSDGEDRGLFQQVFQIWNTRTVSKTLLSKSWVAGKISETDMARINKMLKHSWLGEELPEDIRQMTGIPLLKGYDIRRKFLHDEFENFEALDAESAAWDLELEDVESDSVILEFDVLRGEVSEKLLAAAGKNDLSEAYLHSEQGLKFLQGIELTDFEIVDAGEELPSFCWISETLPAECVEGMTVLFRYKKSSRVIGSGVLNRQDYGWEIILANPVDNEDVPEILTPADIQLVFIGK